MTALISSTGSHERTCHPSLLQTLGRSIYPIEVHMLIMPMRQQGSGNVQRVAWNMMLQKRC